MSSAQQDPHALGTSASTNFFELPVVGTSEVRQSPHALRCCRHHSWLRHSRCIHESPSGDTEARQMHNLLS